MNDKMIRMDIGLFVAVLILLGFGIVFVYSSSFVVANKAHNGQADYYLLHHALRVLIAITVFMIFINIDYHVWGRLSSSFYLVSIILLVMTLIVGIKHNGARRWLSIGPVVFQTSDFARMALIMFLARNCERAGNDIRKWSVLSKILIQIGIICGLILLEPNFSTALILGIILIMMVFLSGAKFMHLASLAASFIPIIYLLVFQTPYRKKRIIGFIDSSQQPNLGYQAFQSLVGLGNGGVFGVGLGKGKQKFFYLPEPHTDFVISILGEEIGFIGLLVIILIYAFIVFRGIKISLSAPDRMGQLMAFGFTSVIIFYVFFHIAVGTALVPTTGIPLPFLSYGGTNIVFMMASVGIILNISSQADVSGRKLRGIRSERLIKV